MDAEGVGVLLRALTGHGGRTPSQQGNETFILVGNWPGILE